jgi:ATP-binding protein involved in chromosome partitioning
MTADRALDQFPDPFLGRAWGALGAIRSVERAPDGHLDVRVALGYPARGLNVELAARLSAAVGAAVTLALEFEPPALSERPDVHGVRNIVAVASGKGGVGKSTTAVNLALALAAEGARVGILDADIYGPSIGTMLGVAEGRRPEVRDEKFFVPIRSLGIEAMSMSFLVTPQTPVVWRGPMASGALQQMLGQTLWGDLDYLIVDMPPGTGDIQLTLAQRSAVAGAVIVTTPQDLALQDARKGIEMFRKVSVPVLGVIENMGLHLCPNCGHASHIFGAGGGERISRDYGTILLASLPLAAEIREHADSGRPTVSADPEGPLAAVYRQAARHLAARLWELAAGAAPAPEISFDDD